MRGKGTSLPLATHIYEQENNADFGRRRFFPCLKIKRTTMKKLLITILVCALAVTAFAACNGGDNSSLPTGTSIQSDEGLANDKFAE